MKVTAFVSSFPHSSFMPCLIHAHLTTLVSNHEILVGLSCVLGTVRITVDKNKPFLALKYLVC